MAQPQIMSTEHVDPEVSRMGEEPPDPDLKAFLGDLRLDEGEQPQRMAESVLCTLARRLTDAEVEDLQSYLPPRVGEMLQPCARHVLAARPHRMDRSEFLAEVAE